MKNKNGFTLIELLIVVLILAILAGIGVYMYTRVVEENRARKAAHMVQILGAARRMQLLDNGIDITSGYLRNAYFQGGVCPVNISEINDISHLQACGYGDLRGVDWDGFASYYRFFSCAGGGSGCCSTSGAPANVIACGWRKSGGPGFSDNWRYFYTDEGSCTGWDDGAGDIPLCQE
jgi:prepilin-type N-terminal cleavage/methylation domain-containing protein